MPPGCWGKTPQLNQEGAGIVDNCNKFCRLVWTLSCGCTGVDHVGARSGSHHKFHTEARTCLRETNAYRLPQMGQRVHEDLSPWLGASAYYLAVVNQRARPLPRHTQTQPRSVQVAGCSAQHVRPCCPGTRPSHRTDSGSWLSQTGNPSW